MKEFLITRSQQARITMAYKRELSEESKGILRTLTRGTTSEESF